MPIPLTVPPIVHAAVPVLLAVTSGPWWALPLLGLLTGVLLMYLTEFVKAHFGRTRANMDLLTARENIEAAREKTAGELRDDVRELMSQNLEMLNTGKLLIADNAELKATVKIQTYQIERLSLDVTKLQLENDSIAPLKAQVAVLEAQVRELKVLLMERDAQIIRLQARQEAREDANDARDAREAAKDTPHPV